jgi:alpha-tubulin suppressor-like RCC1 family protein
MRKIVPFIALATVLGCAEIRVTPERGGPTAAEVSGDGAEDNLNGADDKSQSGGFVRLAAGSYSSLAVLDDGTASSWGSDLDGALGNGNGLGDLSTPGAVLNISDLIDLRAALHSVALRSDGTIWTWGRNDFGSLGDGTTIDRDTPIAVPDLSDVVAIDANGSLSLALRSDGTVWRWGLMFAEPELTPSHLSPAPVPGLDDVVAIAAGNALHALALRADGTVWGWGMNVRGQIGPDAPNLEQTSTPVLIPNLTDVIAIAAGIDHSLALRADGTVWAWGSNERGELGDGTGADSSVPVMVSALSGVKAIAAGDQHCLAVTADGAVWAWGVNSYGQIGDGAYSDQLTPVPVLNLSDVVVIDAGPFHSLALRSDGTLWGWGNNYHGQLGDGKPGADSPVPVQALFP